MNKVLKYKWLFTVMLLLAALAWSCGQTESAEQVQAQQQPAAELKAKLTYYAIPG